MKAAQAKKLIGKPVEWMDTYCPKRGYLVRNGFVLDVKGKNILIERGGCHDWKWLPDLVGLKELVEDAAPQQIDKGG